VLGDSEVAQGSNPSEAEGTVSAQGLVTSGASKMPRLGNSGFNMGELGTSLDYANRGGNAFTENGNNWMPHNMAGLVPDGANMMYERGTRQPLQENA
jgi:hypothetical protein